MRACPSTFKLRVLNFDWPLQAINRLVVVAAIDISSSMTPSRFSSGFLLGDLT